MDNYLEDIFKNNIDKNKVKTVFELGSRDLIDALKLQKYIVIVKNIHLNITQVV